MKATTLRLAAVLQALAALLLAKGSASAVLANAALAIRETVERSR